MKITTILTLCALLTIPACGDANAGTNKLGDMMDKASDAIGNAEVVTKLKSTLGGLTTTLSGITDGKTAAAVKSELGGLVDMLSAQVDKIGGIDKLTGMLGGLKDSLVGGLMSQVNKLANNEEVANAIGPMLEKLKSTLGG